MLLIISAFLILFIIVGCLYLLFTIIGIRLIKKGKRRRGYMYIISTNLFIVTILLCGLSFLIFNFIVFDEDPLSKKNIIKRLKKEDIRIHNDFSILNSNSENDLYFVRLECDIKISSYDFRKLNHSNKDTVVLKNLATKYGLTYDTIKINLTKDSVLHYYSSQYNYDN